MRTFLLSLFLCLGGAAVFARENVQITFAVPDLEGRITLGIFNAKGKLVRMLHQDAELTEFSIGLNGLITNWDGNGNDGASLPSGTYSARGYVVGGVEVEGVAYHFNDWIESEASHKVEGVLDAKLGRNQELSVLAWSGESSSGSEALLFRYDWKKGGILWSRTGLEEGILRDSSALIPDAPELSGDGGGGKELSGVTPLLASSDSLDLVASNGEMLLFDAKNGTLIQNSPEKESLRAIAAGGDKLLLVLKDEIRKFSLPKLEPADTLKTPETLSSLDADGQRMLAAGEKSIFLHDNVWKKMPMELEARSVSLGRGRTFWIAGKDAGEGASFIGQYDFEGGFLRRMLSDALGGEFQKINASRQEDQIVVLEKLPGLQRLRILEANPAHSGKGVAWEIVLEKAIYDCRQFGLVEGKLVANAGDTAQPGNIKFRLDENILTGKREILELRPVSDESGTRLETPEGFPLIRVSNTTGIRRMIALRGDKPDSVVFYQGNGAVVEEFLITGLHHIAAVNAGDFDLK